jgi:hypothetical protein
MVLKAGISAPLDIAHCTLSRFQNQSSIDINIYYEEDPDIYPYRADTDSDIRIELQYAGGAYTSPKILLPPVMLFAIPMILIQHVKPSAGPVQSRHIVVSHSHSSQ